MDCGEIGLNLPNAVKRATVETEKDIVNVTTHKQNMAVLTVFLLTVFKTKA